MRTPFALIKGFHSIYVDLNFLARQEEVQLIREELDPKRHYRALLVL